MNKTRLLSAGSLIEVAWILVKERSEDCMTQEIAGTPIAELCCPPFAVARGPLAVSGKAVIRLLDACCYADTHERGPIECVVGSEGEFLFRSQRSCVMNV